MQRQGGGLYFNASGGATLEMDDSTVSGNYTTGFSGVGGGVGAFLDSGSRLRSTIAPYPAINLPATAAESGLSLTAIDPVTSVTIANSRISGNTAGDRGGGIYAKNFDGTSVLIEDTRITDNHALNGPHGYGGGAYLFSESSYNLSTRPKFTITGSTVDQNTTAEMGGGVFVFANPWVVL